MIRRNFLKALLAKIPRRQKPLRDKTRIWYDYFFDEACKKYLS